MPPALCLGKLTAEWLFKYDPGPCPPWPATGPCREGARSGGRAEAKPLPPGAPPFPPMAEAPPPLAAPLATDDAKPQNFPKTSCVSAAGANSRMTRARTGGCSLCSTSRALGFVDRPHLSRKAASSDGSGTAAAARWCGWCSGCGWCCGSCHGATCLSTASGAAACWPLPWPLTTVFAKARSFALILRVFPRGSNCSSTFMRASSGSDSSICTQLASRLQRTTKSATAGSEATIAAACASAAPAARALSSDAVPGAASWNSRPCTPRKGSGSGAGTCSPPTECFARMPLANIFNLPQTSLVPAMGSNCWMTIARTSSGKLLRNCAVPASRPQCCAKDSTTPCPCLPVPAAMDRAKAQSFPLMFIVSPLGSNCSITVCWTCGGSFAKSVTADSSRPHFAANSPTCPPPKVGW
mmetsp:Transcript_18604/g.50452  ORF Transcript_18604/g.50452 Transcript_18604/m.50452 type:complete len:411 (-) Transcript_18604:466-1698(-)